MSVDYYDRNAEAFFRDTVDADMAGLRERFLAHVPEAGKVLDAGCGSGRDALAFRQAGYEVAAFDGSKEMVRFARDLTGLPVAHRTFDQVAWDQEFDGVWACASLLHVPRNELAGTIGRLHRALRPGGALFVSFKEGDTERDHNGRRFTDLTAGVLDQLLSDHGFEVVDLWTSKDVRPGRAAETWVSAVARRTSAQG